MPRVGYRKQGCSHGVVTCVYCAELRDYARVYTAERRRTHAMPRRILRLPKSGPPMVDGAPYYVDAAW